MHQQYAYSPRGSFSLTIAPSLLEQRVDHPLDVAAWRDETAHLPEAQRLGTQLHHELFAQRKFRFDVVHIVVRAEFGELGRGVGRILESAEMVDQTDALRIDARQTRPCASLVHILHALSLRPSPTRRKNSA